jgi:hypothetical protein
MNQFGLKTLWLAPVLVLLSACQPATPEAVAERLAPVHVTKPVISLQEVMHSLVDPSADAIWNSVSTTVTKAGVEEKQPRTDADWNELRLHALRILAGASLLQVEGIKVVRDGTKIVDTHETYLNEAGIAQAIAKDPAAFAATAKVLESNAQEILTAIDARDIPRLSAAGGRLNEVSCEGCHVKYWYPGQKLPHWIQPIVQK